jgi:hypothetical protein
LDKKLPIFEATFPDIVPTKADLMYGVLITEWHCNYNLTHKKTNYKEGKKESDDYMLQNQPILKTKTLLLRRDWVDPKLTDATIKASYPYPYTLVDKSKMDEYIINADTNYVYGMISLNAFSGAHVSSVGYFQEIFSCKDGALLGFSMLNMGMLVPPGMPAPRAMGDKQFTKYSLKELCKYINGKE